jgi:hypothetical protein
MELKKIEATANKLEGMKSAYRAKGDEESHNTMIDALNIIYTHKVNEEKKLMPTKWSKCIGLSILTVVFLTGIFEWIYQLIDWLQRDWLNFIILCLVVAIIGVFCLTIDWSNR